ncbi:Kinesin-like protein KIN-12F [Camellia lanceoleosa]|uniref:Kinesin-like protein KIN-12F n=1 Tax=Camellia lanceoleosa TaxID=1840588 RepID=A0ACC0H4A4_9ERIC|nr:Kinesin-like protein KIN-12F [Camellia lanceoleosa]
MLFFENQREKENSVGKQINFQCRCSFLEIRDDTKNEFYVENLTEEYVTSYEDITQILIKGLSSRKVGATSIHSESSQSHIVFTCVIESCCKGVLFLAAGFSVCAADLVHLGVYQLCALAEFQVESTSDFGL